MHNLNIFIIGSGNVAFHMAKAFTKNQIRITGLHSRNCEDGQWLAKKFDIPFYPQFKSIPKNADVYLLCISDDAIQSVAEKLPKSITNSRIVAHTSGSKSMEEALPSCKYGGVFYPLQTFTKGKKISYKKIPFCINGKSKKPIDGLTHLAEKISTSVHLIDDNQRKHLHLSAVIINNFVNHLIFNSQELLKEQAIDPSILQPLLNETIQKQKLLGAKDAQTGPARRMDRKTLDLHLDLLKNHKDLKTVYTAISKSIQKTYNKKK